MNLKQVFLISLLILLCSLTWVSATDSNTTEQATNTLSNTETQNIVEKDVGSADVGSKSSDDSNNVVNGTYTELNDEISKANGTLILNKNYSYNNLTDSKYKLGINIEKPLILDGNGYTVSGNNMAGIFTIHASDVTIKNITLEHGRVKGFGGAIGWLGKRGRLENSIITYNAADYGGAVAVLDISIVLDKNKFIRNYAYHSGGALFLASKDTSIINNLFESNEGKSGYPVIYMRSGSLGLYLNNSFINNTEFVYGGSDAGSAVPGESTFYKQLHEKSMLLKSEKVQSENKHLTLSNNYSKVEVDNAHFTLDHLNKLLNHTFTHGHLLVYIDGKLVFNDTVEDDLSIVICHLINFVTGNHEIKVEFTGEDGKTETYTENITFS